MFVEWQERVGNQRDWVWRGWKTRYTYIRNQGILDADADTTPIILLHGFGASIGHWRQNLEVFSEHHTVYALDMLGWGASEKAPVNYSVHFWAEQVYDFWKVFIGKPVVIIGNSLGSLVSLTAAFSHPEMVRGLVMMSLPDPSLEQEAIPPFLRPAVLTIKNFIASPLFLKPLFYFLRQPGVLRRWAAIAYANPEAITDELVDIFALPAQDRGSVRAFTALFKASIGANFSPSVKAILPNLDVPMLLIWGNKDRFVPPSLAPMFAQYNTKLEILNLDNIGHCPHDESPEEINPLILNWIRTNLA